MLLMFSIVIEHYLHMRETDTDQNIEVFEGDACTRADDTIFGTRGHVHTRGKATAKCWCWMALGWPRDLKVMMTRRISQQKKDQSRGRAMLALTRGSRE